MLVFHIGLPKTATTFLQNSIFRHTPEVDMLHRKDGGRAQEICSTIRHVSNASWIRYASAVKKVRRLLRGYEPVNGTVLVAAENISVGRVSFWTDQGAGPEVVARRLASLARALARRPGNLGEITGKTRIVIGVRRQDQWLASRYAGSSSSFNSFSQSDFETRLTKISESSQFVGSLAWLDYAYLRDALLHHFQESDLFFVPSERLRQAAEAERICRDLGTFLGDVDLLMALKATQAPGGRPERNVHSLDPNSWPLRNGAGEITLTPELSTRILERFRESNARFSRHVDIDYQND